MANIKNYGMTGIASDVQYGKAGPRLINSSGVFQFKNTAGSAFADMQAGSLVLSGDLTVQGATTTIETATLRVEDKNIEVGVTYDGSHVEIPATDAGADGGGLTLKGTVDKTLNWLLATGAWTSSESFDLATGKSYMVDGTAVLSKTGLGSTVVSSSLTSLGTLTGLTIASSSSLDFGGNKLTNVANGSSSGDAVNFTQLSDAVSGAASDLSDAIAQEVTDRNSAISTAIATEVTNRNTAIGVETTRATGVEAGLQTEVDAIESGAGLTSAGAYVVLTGSNYLTSATSIANATSLLDTQLKTVSDAVDALGSGSITDLQNEVDAIEVSLGSMVGSDGVWVGFTSTNYLGSVEDATFAFKTLDSELKTLSDDLSAEADARDSAIAAAIAQEVTDRNSAISTAIATEVSDRNSAISTAIATEVTNRNSAISTAVGAEQTRAEGAESALGTRIDDLTTDDVAEGTNKYFSDTLARGALSVDTTTGHTGLEYNSTTGVFGIDQTVIATVDYVDTQDATTLASANAYTDSQVGSAAVNQAKGVYAAFAYTDSSVTIGVITGRVHRIKIYVDAAFDGTTPSIQVGTDATNNQLVATSDNDASGAGVYVVELNQNYASATTIKVFIGGTGNTAGSGSVIVEYLG